MTGSKSSICLLERKGKEAPDLVGLPGARLTREACGPRRRRRVGERGLLRGGSRCLHVRSPRGHPGSTATQSPPCRASRTLRSLPSQGACSRLPRQGPQPSYGPVTRSWKGTNLSAVSTPSFPPRQVAPLLQTDHAPNTSSGCPEGPPTPPSALLGLPWQSAPSRRLPTASPLHLLSLRASAPPPGGGGFTEAPSGVPAVGPTLTLPQPSHWPPALLPRECLLHPSGGSNTQRT